MIRIAKHPLFHCSVVAMGLATPARAHTGDHGPADLMHLLTQPDHLAMIGLGIAVVVLVAVKLWRRS
jgi:hypothetical protein